jgi:hypothetical protein
MVWPIKQPEPGQIGVVMVLPMVELTGQHNRSQVRIHGPTLLVAKKVQSNLKQEYPSNNHKPELYAGRKGEDTHRKPDAPPVVL